MKTKVQLRTIITIVCSLMMILIPALMCGEKNANPPETNYRLNELTLYSDPDSRQIYTYNDCNNLVGLLVQNKSGDDWIDVEQSTYTYDGFGNVLTKSEEHIQDGYTELYTYTRDCNGNVLTELHDYVGWDYAIKTTYEYDCDGHILSKLIQETYDYIEWLDSEKYTYTYDKNGNILVETYFVTWWSGNWDESSYEKYTYDENGNQLTDLTQYWALWENPPTLENDWLTTATYDENGHMLYYIGQSWSGSGWYNNVKETYTYDSDGKRLTSVRAHWQSEMWKNYEKIEYDYLSGQTIGHGYRWIGGFWVPGPVVMKLFIYNEGVETPIWYLGNADLLEADLYNAPKLSIEACPAQTVYYGYPPMACAAVSVNATGGTPPYTSLWDNEGGTSASFEACPTETTDYTVIVTDANGCLAKACTRVDVIDVRCGNNMNKVKICHCPPGNPENCETLCVGMASLPDHLAHGDLLGACGIDRSCVVFKEAPVTDFTETIEEDLSLKVYPNPFVQSTTISYKVNEPGKTTIWLTNFLGQTVSTLFEGYTLEGETHNIEVNMGNLQTGMYMLVLQKSDGSIVFEKLILLR